VPVRVFISYAHDSAAHIVAVTRLWDLLRTCGIDAKLDRPAEERRQDWPLWMLAQLRESRFVIVVASPAYRRRAEGRAEPGDGRGVQFEAALIREEIYRDPAASLGKFLPVLLPDGSIEDIPAFLGPFSTSHYRVDDLTRAGIDGLLRVLTAQPLYPERPLGPVPVLPPAPTALGPDQLATLANLVLRVPGMSSPGTWQLLLDLLPPEIVMTLRRQGILRADVLALLHHFAGYPHLRPWTELTAVLTALAGGAPAVTAVTAEVDRLGLRENAPTGEASIGRAS
jgi:hypothetical protein